MTYEGGGRSAIRGWDNVEGQTVKVLADGAVISDKTVASGAITLDEEASVVQVGLGYTHRMKTLKIEAGAVAGTAQGKQKVITAITFALVNSHTLSFGPTLDNLEARDFRRVSDVMDSAAPLFTGEAQYKFQGGFASDVRVIVESDDPVPFLLAAMAPEIVTNDVK